MSKDWDETAGILCGDRPWNFCDSKAYLSHCKYKKPLSFWLPRTYCSDISKKQQKNCGNCYLRLYKARKHNFRSVNFTDERTTEKEDCRKDSTDAWGELSLNCDIGNHEEPIIRDVLIANMEER